MKRKITKIRAFNVFMIICACVPHVGLACSCAVRPPAERLERSAAVFVGRVQSVTTDTVSVTIGGRRHVLDLHIYTFDVKGVWKGDIQNRVQVVTNAQGSMCGSKFDRNIDYIVYAYKHEGELRTGSCSVNPPLEVAIHDLYSLGLPAYLDSSLSLTPVTVDDLFVIALGEDRKAKYSALVALGTSVVDRDLIERRLLDMLKGDDTKQRLVAVEAFRWMGPDGKSATDELMRAFHSDNDELRLRSFDAIISVNGRRESLPLVMEAINDDTYDLQIRALREASCLRGCLSSDGQQALYQKLVGLIEHPDEQIRCAAMMGLPSCGVSSVSALSALDYIASFGETHRVRKTAENAAMQIRREQANKDK